MLLPSVDDVFALAEDGSISPPCSLSPSKFSPSNRLASASSARASVQQQDIPSVLRKLSEMSAFSADKTRCSSSISSLNNVLSGPDNSAVVFDIDALRAALAAVKDSFPPHWVHCLAIKCCPLAFVIQEVLGAGLGVEAASFVELYMALAHGCSSKLAVFDSPAKTDEELEMAFRSGTLVNANSLDELERIDKILLRHSVAAREAGLSNSVRAEGSAATSIADNARVGIRLNPLVGAGAFSELSTSVPNSKFGVPVTPQNITAVIEAFRRWPWMVGLHVHVGSQGFALEKLGDGIAAICDIADTVDEALGEGRVALLDIGGGLPANYGSDEVTPTFADYADLLRRKVPKLFSNTERTVVTEFGRALMAKAAVMVSKVEYVRENASPEAEAGEPRTTRTPGMVLPPAAPSGHQTLITHMGADLFLRSSYCPGRYGHRLSIYGKDGNPLTGPAIQTEVAGPLCFEGDYLAKGSKLPRAVAGDLVVAHDTGANTISLFSRHCSRRAPAVYGYAVGTDGELAVQVIKEKESVRDVARFWGAR